MENGARQLNPVLKPFWQTPARIYVLYGGRASSKSWDAAGMAIALAQVAKVRFLCTRQIQNKIEESVYALLKIRIEQFGLQSIFKITNNSIICTRTGSEFFFYGLWRHVDEIKSVEGVDIHWSEEAHGLTSAQWEVIEPTLRKGSACHWLIFNPQLVTDFVYREFVTGPDYHDIGDGLQYDFERRIVKRKINYDENSFLDQEFIDTVIEPLRKRDPELFDHIYGGNPRDDDDASIIKRSHCLAAIDAHKKLNIEPRGMRRCGFDVADSGADSCANVYAVGPLAEWADLWKAKEDELLRSCTRVWTAARERNASVIYDAIGVGASAGAKFNELNTLHSQRVQRVKFFAGGKPFRPDAQYNQTGIKNKDFFSNIKAQAWWTVADKLRNTYNAVTRGESFSDDEMIFLSSDMPYLEKLIDELCTPKRDYDLAGRVKVESKKDLDKRDIPSPNLADAFVMCFGGLQSMPMVISKQALARVGG